ncbi:hypothetical protein ACNHYB_11025 [Isoptericola jiangsuensis]|uniref:hypothetical protein n=1 Tax=Isoptericola jiangsuensis TaxID=548579 RepID=UPI003AAB19EF
MSITTSDHDKIRTWAESRSGVPALSDADGLDGRPVPALVFAQGTPSAAAREVSWAEWFAVLDDSNLALRYRDDDGAATPFYELLAR